MTTRNPQPGHLTGLSLLSRKMRSAVYLVTYRGGRARKRLANSLQKSMRHYGIGLKRTRRISVEKIKNGIRRASNLSRLGFRRVGRIHKPFVRIWKRSRKAREGRVERRSERHAERQALAVVRSRKPLVVGPWFSEVGFEVLYWVPFLNWLKAETHFDPDQTVIVSRGGVGAWYGNLASHYFDIFDLFDPVTFARRNHERRQEGDGSHKQLEMSSLDREIVGEVTSRLGFVNPEICHPSLMYRLLRNFWLGHRSLNHVESYTRHRKITIDSKFDLTELPAEYVAVKLYTAASLPDSNESRRLLRALIGRISSVFPVVTLDTGLNLDDHEDYRFDGQAGVVNLSRWMTPQNNLGLQTEVISRAKLFVGTCGSLTWLAPLLGVSTVAVMSDPRFLHPHLYLARKVYLESQAGQFATIDLRSLEGLGLDSLVADGVFGDGEAIRTSTS